MVSKTRARLAPSLRIRRALKVVDQDADPRRSTRRAERSAGYAAAPKSIAEPIRTAASTLALSRGLRGRAGMMVVRNGPRDPGRSG